MRSSAKLSARRKPVGRPRASQRRPVLAARVPEEFYARILNSAAISGRNASEELIFRAQQSYEWEATLKSCRELQAHVRKVSATSLQPMLRELGYTKVGGLNGSAWFEPGVDTIQWIFANVSPESRAVLQEMLNQAATLAVEKVRAQS
jgi:hypothetical protein